MPRKPDWPSINPNLMNIKMLSTFRVVGTKTPENVPSFPATAAGWETNASPWRRWAAAYNPPCWLCVLLRRPPVERLLDRLGRPWPRESRPGFARSGVGELGRPGKISDVFTSVVIEDRAASCLEDFGDVNDDRRLSCAALSVGARVKKLDLDWG
jgi:hypothetical protein